MRVNAITCLSQEGHEGIKKAKVEYDSYFVKEGIGYSFLHRTICKAEVGDSIFHNNMKLVPLWEKVY